MKTVKEEIQKSKADIDGKTLWWVVFITICALTVATRFYKVTEPDHVCWDETHFGKMASWYINRTFFFDVHPPLGKMLIALSGVMTGYNGSYPFEKPGDKYQGAKYEGMRYFCTALGAMIVPFAFLTSWEMTTSLTSAVLGTLFVLCDVGLLTLNRYILLDPILLFFMCGSMLGMVKVTSYTERRESPISLNFLLWQLFLGSMLAGTIGVKFVGLFVVLLAGMKTVMDLWDVLGDLSKPVSETVKHLVSRTVTLIIWPSLLYVLFFWIHLRVLNRSGSGDGFYSSGFQSQLIGNSLYNASLPRHVAYGAIITLKNHKTGGGYLHSHQHLYPENVGARQQQITTYTHKDDNNKWLIKPYNLEKVEDVVLVRHGDLVRLEHITTGRNLHSHREHAPITKKHLQVTGYGEKGVGDANDVWKILIKGGSDGDPILTVTSRLQLIHYLQACTLTSSGKQLPKWGYEQQEVSCNPNIRDKNGLWNVEDNQFDKLPKVNFDVYAPSFLERFIESHAVMFQGNAGLKPKEGEITSQPWQWPLNYRGQFFSGSTHRVYLLGNPIIWWMNLLFLALFLVIFLTNAIRKQRGYEASEDSRTTNSKLLNAAIWLSIGWSIHYVPFWAMGRVLYFHHYFPALIFSSLLSGVLIDYLIKNVCYYLNDTLSKTFEQIVLGVILSSMVYSFYLFAPLAYGMEGPMANEPNSTMHGLRWLDSWEF